MRTKDALNTQEIPKDLGDLLGAVERPSTAINQEITKVLGALYQEPRAETKYISSYVTPTYSKSCHLYPQICLETAFFNLLVTSLSKTKEFAIASY